MNPTRHNQRYRLLLIAAAGVVIWERLWRRLWPAGVWSGLFLAVALLDLLPKLPGNWHLVVLVIFAGGFVLLCYRGLMGFEPVGPTTARRRIERDSGLDHHPLGALDDRLAAGVGDYVTKTLWNAHLDRITRATQKLRLRPPSPGLFRVDRYAIRVPVMLLLVISLAAAGGDVEGRLKRAFNPQFSGGAETQVGLEIWITPPAYTKMAPLFLNLPATGIAAAKTIRIPTGSSLLARIDGVASTPRLVIGASGKKFSAINGDGYQVKAMIEKGNRLAVKALGRELASWPINVVVDNPPVISFTAPAKATGKAYLRINYKADDDYGVSRVTAIIRLENSAANSGELRVELPLPRPGATKIKTSSVRDLSAHPWAGMEVKMHLEAVDGRGQTGVSQTISQRLPERKFNHPVARAIIKERRKLADPSADRRDEVISGLLDIMADPGRFADNVVVYLSLGVARSRLVHEAWPDARLSVEKLLWDTALKIEDGDLSIAEQNLRTMQEKLMRALNGKPSQNEVESLIDGITQAMNRYLSALARKIGRQKITSPLNMQSMELIKGNELKNMVKKIREMLRAGAVDAARQMLEKLQRLTDNMRSLDNPPAGAKKAARVMKRLRSISNRQRKLLDRTFRMMQSAKDKAKAKSTEYADEQNKLRRDLGDAMLEMSGVLGSIPNSMGKARQAMRAAAEELTLSRLGPAVRAESKASELLRQAVRDAAGKIAQRLGGMSVLGGTMKGGYYKNRDPFGRLGQGTYGNGISSVKIPKFSDIRRSRKILNELRRRVGESRRKKPEIDYIKRLLRQF